MIIYWLTGIVLLIDISLLLVNDFFPGTLDALGIPLWTLFIVLAIVAFTNLMTYNQEIEKRFRIFSTGLLIIFPVFLVVLLPAIGGESSTGISLTSPFLWFYILLFLWSNWRQHIKESKQADEPS
ncbi:hypothetical protein AUC31_12200 [Planococcus rifietoensis]|uniref:Uncharacterized protein n=1 Tax=Planococcus rifietoensis TaxID=200991 RepID=A0A0U2ZFA5_9BACL|nr:hypothetical protein [Planococcus rifietoensis]ALS75909.1 hypothetical protein AUC31_12200 [Planococcus rifietoensis]